MINSNFIRNLYEAFARGDVGEVLAGFDLEIRWREADSFIYADGNPYVGADAIVKGIFTRLATEWDGFTVSPEKYIDAGEEVVVLGTHTGTYKATGRSVRAQFAHIWSLRDGKVTHFQEYTDTLQFRTAVGG